MVSPQTIVVASTLKKVSISFSMASESSSLGRKKEGDLPGHYGISLAQ
jgi:hypothetical protein